MTPAADLFTAGSALAVMELSLYMGFKSYRAIRKARASESTHLRNRPLGREVTFGRGLSPEYPVRGCFSSDTVNPSLQQVAEGVGVDVAGDRRRVFKPNTKMNTISISTNCDGTGQTVVTTPHNGNQRGTFASRVVQGRPFYPGRDYRRTASGWCGDVQGVQGRTRFYQTNEANDRAVGREESSSKHIGINAFTLDIPDMRGSPRRRLSVNTSRVQTPTLDVVGRERRPIQNPRRNPAELGVAA